MVQLWSWSFVSASACVPQLGIECGPYRQVEKLPFASDCCIDFIKSQEKSREPLILLFRCWAPLLGLSL